MEEWTEKERLAFEKEAIGFYVSGHPLHQYEKELKRYARPITAVQRARRDEKMTVAGIVAAMRERPTKTGKRMAWVTLEDLSGSVELVCFPGKDGARCVMGKDGKWGKEGPKPGYEQWEHLLKSDDPHPGDAAPCRSTTATRRRPRPSSSSTTSRASRRCARSG